MRNTLAVPSPMKSTAPQTVQESSTGDAGSSHATVAPRYEDGCDAEHRSIGGEDAMSSHDVHAENELSRHHERKQQDKGVS